MANQQPSKSVKPPEKHGVFRYVGRVSPVVAADAFPPIAKFFAEHAAEYERVGLARHHVDQVARAHRGLVEVIAKAGESLRRGETLPAGGKDLVDRAHHYLFVARDALRRKDEVRADAAAQRRFGLDLRLVKRSPEALRPVLQAFLAGAAKDKDTLARAYVTREFVETLKHCAEELDELVETRNGMRLVREGMTSEGSRAHAALETFMFGDFPAATDMAYADDEGTRVMALRLVPRDEDRRGRRRTVTRGADAPAAGATGSAPETAPVPAVPDAGGTPPPP